MGGTNVLPAPPAPTVTVKLVLTAGVNTDSAEAPPPDDSLITLDR